MARGISTLAMVAGAAFLITSSAAAQVPDKFTNLQVLPKDIAKDKLVATMRGFATGLGVRCNYCHQAASGKGMDFASDDLDTKKVARGMMRMTQEINTRLLPQVGRPGPLLAVKCMTCHHGITRPEALVDVLEGTLGKRGVPEAIAQYEELRAKYYGQGAYDFSARTLSELAERMSDSDIEGAITVQEFNVKTNPGVASSHSLLADLYLDKGDRAAARVNLERAVALDPADAHYKKKLDELTMPSPAPSPAKP